MTTLLGRSLPSSLAGPSPPTTLGQQYKICIVGNAGVGKSAIIQRLVKNVFLYEYFPTRKIEIAMKVFQQEQKCYSVEIWEIK